MRRSSAFCGTGTEGSPRGQVGGSRPRRPASGAWRERAEKATKLHWDTQALLAVVWNQWNTVFNRTLGAAERSIVSELRDVRNKWAHQEAFASNDAYRAWTA